MSNDPMPYADADLVRRAILREMADADTWQHVTEAFLALLRVRRLDEATTSDLPEDSQEKGKAC